MRYLYYVGCVIPYRAPNYDLSSRVVLEHFAVELVDMPEAGCCGIYLRQVDELKSLVLAARIWSMAEKEQLDILSPCPGCVSTLIHARDRLNNDQDLKEQINRILAHSNRIFTGERSARHLFRVLREDIGLERIAQSVVEPIPAALAAHYGCHLVRPWEELEFDDPEDPTVIDDLIQAVGAESLEYPDKMGCCGMNVHGKEDLRPRLAGQKLLDGLASGAQSFVTGCPACYLALGLNQPLAERVWEESLQIPVIFLPQLLGLALGYRPEELGLDLNRPRFALQAEPISGNGEKGA